jgi:hypothetical protein
MTLEHCIWNISDQSSANSTKRELREEWWKELHLNWDFRERKITEWLLKDTKVQGCGTLRGSF